MVIYSRDRATVIKKVDGIARLLSSVIVQVRCPVCGPVFALNHGKGAMGHITRVPLPERAGSARKAGVALSALRQVLLSKHLEWPMGSIAWKTLGKG